MSSRVFKFESYQTEKVPLQIHPVKLNGKSNGTVKHDAGELYNREIEQGYQVGYQQGLQQAYQEVQQQSVQTVRDAEEKASLILAAAEQERISLLKSTEPQIAELAIMVAKKILGDAFNTDQQLITRVVAEAIDRVSVSITEIKIMVCPEDYPWVNEALPLLKRDYPHLKKIDLEVRNDLYSGDCLIDSRLGVVDAKIDTQLIRLRQALLALE